MTAFASTWVTVWSAEAFVKQRSFPACHCGADGLPRALARDAPVQSFLRHDLRVRKKQFVPRLKSGGITERFRKRDFADPQGLHNAVYRHPVCKHPAAVRPYHAAGAGNFKTEVLENKLAGYQYILKTPTLTENESAEPFCLASSGHGDRRGDQRLRHKGRLKIRRCSPSSGEQ